MWNKIFTIFQQCPQSFHSMHFKWFHVHIYVWVCVCVHCWVPLLLNYVCSWVCMWLYMCNYRWGFISYWREFFFHFSTHHFDIYKHSGMDSVSVFLFSFLVLLNIYCKSLIKNLKFCFLHFLLQIKNSLIFFLLYLNCHVVNMKADKLLKFVLNCKILLTLNASFFFLILLQTIVLILFFPLLF